MNNYKVELIEWYGDRSASNVIETIIVTAKDNDEVVASMMTHEHIKWFLPKDLTDIGDNKKKLVRTLDWYSYDGDWDDPNEYEIVITKMKKEK